MMRIKLIDRNGTNIAEYHSDESPVIGQKIVVDSEKGTEVYVADKHTEVVRGATPESANNGAVVCIVQPTREGIKLPAGQVLG